MTVVGRIGTISVMPTPQISVDALTNSAIMLLAKDASKNGIDLYRADPNGLLRNLLRGYYASVMSDQIRAKPAKRTKK